MSEDTGSAPQAGAPDTSGIAMEIAMEEARSNPLHAARVDAFLDEQIALATIQKQHLQRHLREQGKQLRWSTWEKRLGVLLRAATAGMGLAVAGALAFMLSDAMHSNDLRIEPFSVPPQFAAGGLTGEVVAARILDRLTVLQSQSNTARPAQSFTNSWGENGIKLEIPETGVSFAELDQWLRQKFGNDIRLTGEIVRTDSGITLTARAGALGAESVSGSEDDVDALTNRLAEAIYRITQPYRYAIYLMRHENRPADALPIFRDLALNGGPVDRRWSYNMWAQAVELSEGNRDAGLRLYQQAQQADPDAMAVYANLVPAFYMLGRFEEALQTQRLNQAKVNSGLSQTGLAPTPEAKRRAQANLDAIAGAFQDALPMHAQDVRTGRAGFGPDGLLYLLMRDQIGAHDLAAARISQAAWSPGPQADFYRLLIAFHAGDWRRALGLGGAMAAFLKATPNDRQYARVNYLPPLALAQAQLGDFAAAERSIAPTPANCYPCQIARARIAELQGQQARTDWWFTKATDAGPSLPFAFEAEGRALLGRGEPDHAIARFTLANQKSPHFADAIEGWGEALMAKNQSHLALAKFAEAEKYAPNWGRLHLKWGQALAYAGKPDEAKAKFARAAQFDLIPSEKAELASFDKLGMRQRP